MHSVLLCPNPTLSLCYPVPAMHGYCYVHCLKKNFNNQISKAIVTNPHKFHVNICILTGPDPSGAEESTL